MPGDGAKGLSRVSRLTPADLRKSADRKIKTRGNPAWQQPLVPLRQVAGSINPGIAEQQKGQALADFTRPRSPNLLHPLPARATVRHRTFETLFEKSVGLTFGLLTTLTLALGLQRSLPQREHLPVLLFGALRAQAEHVLAQPSARSAPRPMIALVTVRTVMANAEEHISPHRLLARWQPYIQEASRRFDIP